MKSQKELIEKGDWDTLILLDACRFDSFKNIYKNYFSDGNLRKVRSEGSSTGEWLYKTFPRKYDFTYLSTNPYINSYGIPLSKCNPDYKYDWNAVDHFTDIIDVWDERWNDDLETVLPKDVNEIYIKRDIEGRTLIHYMQPHLPYLSLGNFGSFDVMKTRARDEEESTENLKEALDKVLVIFEEKFEKIIGTHRMWELKKMYNLRARSGYERTWRAAGGVRGLKKYYMDNLNIVLKNVIDLIGNLDGKIVITSDHGEAFGENGIWFHELERDEPILIEVPWFELDLDKY